MLGRLLVGDELHRPLAGAHGVVDRLRQLAGRRGDEEVMRELRDVRLRVGAVLVLEREADVAVQAATAVRADVVVERLADEAVGEPVRAERRRAFDDDAELDGLAERGVELGGL